MKKAAIVGGVLLVGAYLVWLLSQPAAWANIREHPISVALGVLAIAAYVYITWRYQGHDPAPPAENLPPLSNTFGSAHYAPQQSTPEDDGALVSSGVFFGKSHTDELISAGGPGAPICSRPANHSIIFARTRTGKGTRVILPTLLANRGRTSFFVIDPKGENFSISARARAQHSYVQIINPWNELGDTCQKLGFSPATFNPLDVLDVHDPNVVAVAESLAGAICPNESSGKDSYWSHSAASLMTAVLLWVTEREGLSFPGQPPEKKTLARAREIVSLTRSQLREYLKKMVESKAFGGAMREHAAPFIDLAPETYSGVISNLARFTRFISDPQIKAATETSSFSMSDLTGSGKDRPTTLYLVIPPDRVDAQKTWLKLMIAGGMATFKRKGPGSKYRCTFLIDEFPALGRLEDVPRDIATMAGYGVDFVLIVQGLAQLKEIYGEAHGDILNNCAYKWFCNVSDLQSAEFLSKTLGNKTVRTVNTSESSGESKSPGGPSTNQGKNTSYGETGRALLTPDEVLNLGRDIAILLAPNSRPHYLRPIDHWKLQSAFEDFRAGYPDLFWPLYYDPNPYLPANAQQHSPDAVPKPIDLSVYAPKPTQSSITPPAPVQTTPDQMPSGQKIDFGLYAPKGAESPKPAPESKPYDYDLYAPKKPKG